MSLSDFIHLRNYTQYSLSLGALRINDLTKFCLENKCPAIGISDKGNLFGSMEFSLECLSKGIQPIISCDLLIDDSQYKAGNLMLTISSEAGYRSLSKLVSISYLENNTLNKPFLKLENILKYNEGLICFSGGAEGLIKSNFLNFGKDKALELINIFKKVYKDRFFFEIQREKKLQLDNYLSFLINISYENKIPLVATNENFFINQDFHESHDALICISQQTYVDSEKRKKVSDQCFLKSPDEMIKLFDDIPSAISNSISIAKKCSFILNEKKPSLPRISSKENEDKLLRKSSIDGLEKKINFFSFSSEEKKIYFERINFELNIISNMGYSGYFLIVSDFIKWAKKNKVPVGPGRGSGAGSLVAWCLTITDIDPIRFGLLFERFLNPERVSMPDFDIDFCMDKRDDVIKYVQDKYTKDCVAQIITFGSFQARAALRDVGRVLQIPYDQVDYLCKLIPFNPAKPTSLSEAIKSEIKIKESIKNNPIIKRLFKISQNLEGLLRHASTHAAGLVISGKPLIETLPLYRDPRSDFPVTQFSMKYVEKIGLIKFDFLGLKTLTVIEKTCKLLLDRNINLDIESLPLNDEKTFKLLKIGKTIGVFQFDGKGMRETLIKVKPDRFEDLIAIVSLYRPGPMDNIPLYVQRKRSKEKIEYIHNDLDEILGETYGIMVYQEQVMQIAKKLAGFSLAKADLLRRAMGKKIKKEMDAQKESFIKGCYEKNIDSEKANELFDEIEKFAGYGFNKSHAAAYALVSYQTAYLKAHYPVEFFCAHMECEINNVEKLSVFSKEVKSLGYIILQPDLNKSFESFKVSIEEGKPKGIKYALGAIKNVGENSIKILVNERERKGEFKSLIDLLNRIESSVLNKRQLEYLIFSGAFNSIEKNQCFLEKNIERILKYNSSAHKEINKFQNNLFDEFTQEKDQFDSKGYTFWDVSTKLIKEHESIGFFLSKHPVEYFDFFLSKKNNKKLHEVADLMNENENRNFDCLVIVNSVVQRKSRMGKDFAFFSLSDDTYEIETICFSDTLNSFKDFPKVGDLCYVKLEVLNNNDTKKLALINLKKIELDKKMLNERILIEINLNNFDLNKFKSVFANKYGGLNSMDFLVKRDNLNFLVKTKEKFNLDLKFLNNLKEIKGIENIKRLN